MTEALEKNDAGIPMRMLGRTGLKVSIIGLGGGHHARPDDERTSFRLVHEAVDRGVTFMDNAWEYWNGEAERRMGIALEGRRDKVTLMTKVCARDRKGAEEQLDDSLRKLKTDVIDVWQFHEINYDNDPDWVFQPGGAIEAAIAARDAGKVRFIGFTGHKSPHIFAKMLAHEFEWDTVQMPTTVMDAHYRSFQNEILPELQRRNIGVIGMKSLGGEGQIVTKAKFTVAEARGYALSLPISTLICGIQSMENLEQDVAFARDFVPYSEQQMAELRDRSAPHAADGRYEWFKSTQFHDSQYHRDQHCFPPIGSVARSVKDDD